MSWTPNKKEIASVIKMDGAKRYMHFIKKVADNEIVWSLRDDEGWALSADDSAIEAIPVWPHREYASICAAENWQGFRPEPIDLDIWLTRWIPGIDRDKRKVAVFPTPNGKGVCVNANRLSEDIRAELQNYE